MKQLYKTDSYIKSCETTISDFRTEKKKTVIVCSENIFYPKGGGQPCDTGIVVINDEKITVKKVKKFDGKVWLFLDKYIELAVNQKVRCLLDWKKRHNNMRLHTAAHVVMGAIKRNVENFSADKIEILDDSTVNLEFQGDWEVSESTANAIINVSNEIIKSNLSVVYKEFTDFETALNEYSDIYRGSLAPSYDGNLRLVVIENWDANPCAGTHVGKLEEIGIVSLSEYAKNRFQIKIHKTFGHMKKQMITLFVSAICNLKCEYCYVPRENDLKSEHRRINVKFACRAIDDYFSQTQNYYIRFFGAGEPTLAFKEMNEIFNFSKKLATKANKHLTTELQSNGFFDDDDIAEWISKNVDILWISFDGLPELNDVQRPSRTTKNSTEVVLKNIKRFAQELNMQFGVRVTITNGNFHRQIEILEYLNSLGVKNICVSPSYTSTVNESVSSPEILDFAKHYIRARSVAVEKGMSYQTHLTVNFGNEVEMYCRACVPSPHVTTDGFISCCDWTLFGEEYLSGVLSKLIYGKYHPETDTIIYDNEKIKELQARNTVTLGRGACKRCSILKNCAGGCVGKTIVVSGDLYKPSEEWCKATKYLWKNLPENDRGSSCFHS